MCTIGRVGCVLCSSPGIEGRVRLAAQQQGDGEQRACGCAAGGADEGVEIEEPAVHEQSLNQFRSDLNPERKGLAVDYPMLFFAPFVLYREVLISTSRRDARLTWMLYRKVRMSRETGCRERPSLRQIIIPNHNFPMAW